MAKDQLLIPVRMLTQFAYCKRLGYLEWAQSEFETNKHVIEGHIVHKVVNQKPEEWDFELEGKQKVSSVKLSGPKAGLIAVLDLIEIQNKDVIVIEYKKGSVPENPEKSWEPDRIQLAAQAIILRENGFHCDEGFIYYAGSRSRTKVVLEDRLIEKTLEVRNEFLEVVNKEIIPPPLEDSPKCIGCSLAGICLPDETLFLQEEKRFEKTGIRRLVPARDNALPMHVQLQGAYIGKQGEELVVKKNGKVIQKARLIDVSQLCVFGNIQISTQAQRTLLAKNIPILYFTLGGYFVGQTKGLSHKNVELRIAQYKAFFNEGIKLELAKAFVVGKIKNSRRILMRNLPKENRHLTDELNTYLNKAEQTKSIESLLGIEGIAAKTYFQGFSLLLKEETGFNISERNRRPPKDPVNALLSYTYSLLTREYTVISQSVGLDPHLGFYHAPRYGRPALALDLMEEMRPVIADSIVLNVINKREIVTDDFLQHGKAVAMKEDARKKLIYAYERKMDSLVTHPVFGYSISYRRIIEVQCRLLSRFLLNEIDMYPAFVVR